MILNRKIMPKLICQYRQNKKAFKFINENSVNYSNRIEKNIYCISDCRIRFFDFRFMVSVFAAA